MKEKMEKKGAEMRELKGGNLQDAARYAESARMYGGTMGAMPSKGPAKEPNKVNGVPMMPERGMSKKY